MDPACITPTACTSGGCPAGSLSVYGLPSATPAVCVSGSCYPVPDSSGACPGGFVAMDVGVLTGSTGTVPSPSCAPLVCPPGSACQGTTTCAALPCGTGAPPCPVGSCCQDGHCAACGGCPQGLPCDPVTCQCPSIFPSAGPNWELIGVSALLLVWLGASALHEAAVRSGG